MTPKAILLVDDDAIILLALKQALSLRFGRDYRYETATDGEAGLGCIEKLTVEGVQVILVISDWLMPGMKGDEFLIRVRKLYPMIKLIMLTGHADESEMKRLSDEVDLEAFIRKPWARERLFEVVEKALRS